MGVVEASQQLWHQASQHQETEDQAATDDHEACQLNPTTACRRTAKRIFLLWQAAQDRLLWMLPCTSPKWMPENFLHQRLLKIAGNHYVGSDDQWLASAQTPSELLP